MQNKGVNMVKTNIPEAQYIEKTITLREMRLPPEVEMTKKSLVRWFALSIGLISEEESRQTVLDVIDAFLYYQFKEEINPTTNDIFDYMKQKNKAYTKRSSQSTEKLIRYHLNHLSALNIIQRKNRTYSLIKHPTSSDITDAIQHSLNSNVSNTFDHITQGFVKLSDLYKH